MLHYEVKLLQAEAHFISLRLRADQYGERN